MASAVKKFLPLPKLTIRNFSQSSVRLEKDVPSKAFKRLKENQRKFQRDDGVPIYLKKGVSDKIIYQSSLWGTIVGAGLSVQCWIELANKRG